MLWTIPSIGLEAKPPSSRATPSSVVQSSPAALQRTGSADSAIHGSVK